MVLIFLDNINGICQNLSYPETGNDCDEAVLIAMIAGMVIMMMTMSVVKVMMMTVKKKKCAEAQRKWIRQSGRSRAELR